jgi:hypothetical protein
LETLKVALQVDGLLDEIRAYNVKFTQKGILKSVF